MRFIKVDLPAFGGPRIATKPARKAIPTAGGFDSLK
jgi:hypothetical protein